MLYHACYLVSNCRNSELTKLTKLRARTFTPILNQQLDPFITTLGARIPVELTSWVNVDNSHAPVRISLRSASARLKALGKWVFITIWADNSPKWMWKSVVGPSPAACILAVPFRTLLHYSLEIMWSCSCSKTIFEEFPMPDYFDDRSFLHP